MEREIDNMISEMTLEEKASLCSGLDLWNTKSIKRLKIPSIMVTDGPHGLRKQRTDASQLGITESVPATCFPSGATLASSWNRQLMEEVGEALGRECQAENVSILLGPAVNIKRSPLCGRNFEYFSEDPFLSSEMATHHIKGVQSQGVGTSLKHFAVNNQEHRRMSVSAQVDERTLREIYLASFERAVKQAQPWTVMCSYNRINGTYASESSYLLTDILREEWGYSGFVMSDWGAVNERVAGLAAGLDLEMPGSRGERDAKIIEAVKGGTLSEAVLDKSVARLLRIVLKAREQEKLDTVYDMEEHHNLAKKAANESMVLLKNDDRILPLNKGNKVAIIGEFADNPRYQGGGSSHINPTRLDSTYEQINKAVQGSVTLTYARGYLLDADDTNATLVDEAKHIAADADIAVVFVGLPDSYESEGYDREHLRIPGGQQRLLDAVLSVQKNTVVVLSNGSPIEMPWIDGAQAVLEGYLGGQAMGSAIADILLGKVNPSGKLAETFPQKLSDNPSFLNFPGEGDTVAYKEGIFVGYRYYDAKGIEPLFPFGHGLSYTTFEYTGLSLDQDEILDSELVTTHVSVKNIGQVSGKEVVQLYVRDKEASVSRPEKELKEFAKIELSPGEEQVVSFTLDKRSFAYYDESLRDWHVETGEFEIGVGSSSRDIRLRKSIVVNSTSPHSTMVTRNTLVGDLLRDPDYRSIMEDKLTIFQEQSGFGEVAKENPDMIRAMVQYLPLRGMVSFSQGAFSEDDLSEVILKLNNKNRKG